MCTDMLSFTYNPQKLKIGGVAKYLFWHTLPSNWPTVRRGGPSVLASSINIVHALFVYFLLIVAIICTIIDQQTLYTTGKSVYLPP